MQIKRLNFWQSFGGSIVLTAMTQINLWALVSAAIFYPLSAAANLSEVEIQQPISFFALQQGVRAEVVKQFEQLYGTNCLLEPYARKSKSGYFCGELPMGKIVDDGHKSLLSFKLKKGEIKKLNRGAVNLSRDAEFQLLLKRRGRSTQAKISLIEKKRAEDVTIQWRVDRNVFVRTSPHGQSLWTHACLYLPQLEAVIKPQTLYFDGHQKKKFLWKSIKGKFTASSDVSVGSITIQEARVCSVFKTTMEGPSVDKLRPKTELVKMGLPEIIKMEVSGLKVTNTKAKLKGTFAKIFSSVLKAVGIADIPAMIRAEVQTAVKREVNRQLSVTEAEIRNGTWVRKSFAHLFSESKITKNTALAFRDGTRNAFEEARRVPNSFSEDCSISLRQASRLIDPTHTTQFCRHLFYDVKFQPFARFQKYIDRGCYDHNFPIFAYPGEPENMTWRSECAVVATLTIAGHSQSEKSLRCLANEFRLKRSRSELQARCSSQLVADYLGLKQASHVEALNRSPNPQAELLRLKYSQAELLRIMSKIKR